MKDAKLRGLVFAGLLALVVVAGAAGCGVRVGNSFVLGTPSIHELDNERLKLNATERGS